MENINGILMLYMNMESGLSDEETERRMEVFKRFNKDLIEGINNSTSYKVMIVPTTKEACRIEKVDFDLPFPRFVSRHVDIAEIERRREERERRQREREDRYNNQQGA